MPLDLGKVGIWSRELRYNPDPGARAAAAAELEELGYSALFIPDVGGDVLGAVAELLAATRRVPLATGILNIWMHDPVAVARGHADLGLSNYVQNLRRLGFTDDDLRGPASDKLVDALVAHGDEGAIAARVRAHHDAGADHVCLHVLGGPGTERGEELPLATWRRLAPALAGA
jgi:hypothetical protein